MKIGKVNFPSNMVETAFVECCKKSIRSNVCSHSLFHEITQTGLFASSTWKRKELLCRSTVATVLGDKGILSIDEITISFFLF